MSVIIISCLAVGAGLWVVFLRPPSLEKLSVSSSTIVLAGGGKPVTLSGTIPAGTYTSVSAAILSIETPSLGQQSPANLSIQFPNGKNVWNWPYPYGEFSVSNQTSPLEASNSSATRMAVWPAGARIQNGVAAVQALHDILQTPYSMTLTVGNTPVLSRVGGSHWLPFTPISWVVSPNGTSTASVVDLQNGSAVLALGDNLGNIQIYRFYPGGLGSEVYSDSISTPTPILLMTSGDFLGNGVPDIVTATQSIVNVFTAAGPQSSWTRIPILLPYLNGSTSSAKGLAWGSYPSGNPFIVVSTASGGIFVSNWTLGGPWDGWNQFHLLAQVSGGPMSLSTAKTPFGSTEIAFGDSEGIQIANINASGSVSIRTLSNMTGTNVNTVALNSSGEGIVAGGADGRLYRAQYPNWTLDAFYTSNNSSPVTSVSMTYSDGQDLLVTDDYNYQITAIVSPFNSQPEILPIANGYGPVAWIGGITGNFQPDVYSTGSNGMYVAESEQLFDSAIASKWTQTVQNIVSYSAPTTDTQGNKIVDVPVSLSVSGGEAELSTCYASYNSTITVNVTPLVSKYFEAQETARAYFPIQVNSEIPGAIHMDLTVYFVSPSTASQLGNFLNLVYSQDVVLSVVILGGALTVVGFFRYHRRGSKESGGRRMGTPRRER